MKNEKIAVVYDWVNQWGGAERLLTWLGQAYPETDLYTSVYDSKKAPWAKKHFKNIYSSWLNYLPLSKSKYYWYFPLLPLAFQSFNFKKYDLVISVTTYPGKFIKTIFPAKHLCYCLTPPRFLWQKESLPVKLQKFFPLAFYWRMKDVLAAQNPDLLLSSCQNVQKRIKKFYQREAKVIYPGVDLEAFKLSVKKRQDYFLLVSRLVDYKKVDLAIKAFNDLGWKLKIIGEGRGEKKLKALAKGNIEFLGSVCEKDLVLAYQGAKAVVFPQKEDFGLAPLEAQACGTPVLAFKKGGALETVMAGRTGEFFFPQNEKSLIQSLQAFVKKRYNFRHCRENAERFSKEAFVKNFKKEVEK